MQYDELAERVLKMPVIQERLEKGRFLARLTGELLDGETFEYTEEINARDGDNGFYELAMFFRNVRYTVGWEKFDSLQNRKIFILNVGCSKPLLKINALTNKD